MRWSHPNYKGYDATVGKMESTWREQYEADRPFACDICDRRLRSAEALVAHKRDKHGEVK